MLPEQRLRCNPIPSDRCATIRCPCCWRAPWPRFGPAKSPSGSRFQCAAVAGTAGPAARACWAAATTWWPEEAPGTGLAMGTGPELVALKPAEKYTREKRRLASDAFPSFKVHGLRRHIQTRDSIASGVALARETAEHRHLLHVVKKRIKDRNRE